MRIRIEKLVYGGAGMARTEQGVVFVDGVLPDEEVEVELVDRRKDYAKAKLSEILEPSPDRRDPLCPNFHRVACCDWGHIGSERQRQIKESILRESLARLGGIEWSQPIEHVTGPEVGYRLRASFRVHDGQLCFVAKDSGQSVPIERCESLMPALNDFVLEAREALTRPQLTGTEVVRAVASPDSGEIEAVFQTGKARFRWLDRYPVTTVNRFQYRLRPDHFFQPNRFLLEPFMSAVESAAGQGKMALDLFCGSGFFTLPLSARYARVIGIDRRSVANALWNARRNKVENVDFVKASTGSYLKNTRLRPDTLILDPPRTGAGKGVVHRIASLAPHRIVYVSCNPTTLASDSRRLVDRGYKLGALQSVDQFPNTHHIETIAVFERS